MPTLNWIGKKAVQNHHREVPFHLLKDDPSLSVDDPGSGNLIVEGDNLLALKALLPYYAGQVKCIYIDPPYNTGNENWVYNDNVNSPEMKEWLGKVVGKEAEDLCRHDKWLCMMYPRLSLLRRFLRDDGVIFISIDDIEVANLITILDEIFGRDCRLAIFSWVRKKKGSNLSKEFRKITEYVVAYKSSNAKIELLGAPAYAEKKVPLLNRANPACWLFFPAGKILVGNGVKDGKIAAGMKGEKKGELAVRLEGDINIRDKVIQSDFRLYGRWRWSQDTVNYELDNGSKFEVSKDFRINVSRFNQSEKFKAPQSLLSLEDGVGTNEDATDELRDIFPEHAKLPFDFPKPSTLIQFLVRAVCHNDKKAIILDSFAGSGTTGHALLRLNKETGGARRFILVEMDSKITREITAKRIIRVAEGYKNAKGEQVEGLGGGFRYSTLGEPLFDETGNIRKTVRFADLARHVYFTETGEPLPRQAKANSPLIGVCRGVGVYLLYNGILKDKTLDGGNVLTTPVLAHLPKHDGPKIIYGTACRIGAERLRREGIVFKQLPYKLKVDAL